MSFVKNLHKNWPGFSLEVPSLEIQDQGVTALWGPSGSGKSTLLRILLGLEDCQGYSWIFRGRELSQLPIQDRKLGAVFQGYALFPHLTARRNIWFAAEARRRKISEAEIDFQKLTASLELAPFLDRKAEDLSGGEQQRVALARALISKPEMLFLDEPFSALNEELQVQARAITKKCLEEWKIPAILVTHNRLDLESLATKIIKISNGRILEESV